MVDVDRAQVIELLPHYAANLLLVVGAIAALRTAVGNLGLVVELGVVVAVVLLYPTLVRQLGVEPDVWERR